MIYDVANHLRIVADPTGRHPELEQPNIGQLRELLQYAADEIDRLRFEHQRLKADNAAINGTFRRAALAQLALQAVIDGYVASLAYGVPEKQRWHARDALRAAATKKEEGEP